MTKLVTIILPTYNARRFLDQWKREVDSMVGRGNVKILAIDNGSSDGSQEFVKEKILTEDGDLFFQNDVNLGHAGSCQRALDMVDTPYCVYINADDYHGPEYISRSVDHLESHPETAVTFGHSYIFPYDMREEGPAKRQLDRVSKRQNSYPLPGLYRGDLLKACYANCPVDAGLLVRTSAVRAIGGFQHDCWFVLVQHNNNVCFLDVAHLYSGKHSSQESKRYVKDSTSHQIVWKFFNAISTLLIESSDKFAVHEVLHCSRLLGVAPENALNLRLHAAKHSDFLKYSADPILERKFVYTMLDVLCATIAMETITTEGDKVQYQISNMGLLPLGTGGVNERLVALWELAKAHKVLPEEQLVSPSSMLSHFKLRGRVSPL